MDRRREGKLSLYRHGTSLIWVFISIIRGWLADENDLLWFPVHSAYRDVEEGRDTVQLSSQDDL